MIVRNSIFFLTLMTVFLSSCSTTAIDIDKTFLLEPESFIAEWKAAIDQTVAFGPQVIVDLEQQQEISNNERREITKEERKNNSTFAKKLSKYADIYINDAFGTAHRKHASNNAITHFLPSYAGLLI